VYDLMAALCQVMEQLEFMKRQADGCSPRNRALRPEINHQFAYLHSLDRWTGTAKHRLYPFEQFFHVGWFGDVIIGSEPEALYRVGRNRLMGNFDVSNVLNGAAATSYNNTYGPNWQNPTNIQLGRFVKLGAQIDF